MNDQAAARTAQVLLGPPGSQMAAGGFDHPDAADGMRRWNPAPLIADGLVRHGRADGGSLDQPDDQAAGGAGRDRFARAGHEAEDARDVALGLRDRGDAAAG
jgi:hypothetical protein